MSKIGDILRILFDGIARSKVAVIGAIMSVMMFPFLLISAALDMQGLIKNPYFGFLTYMVMGPVFVLGLVLVLFGVLFCKNDEEIGVYAFEYLKEQFTKPGRFTRVRRLILLTTVIINLTFLVVVMFSYSAFHYTESVSFCAQFCHEVMRPEFITYQNSPHSRVPCVECHLGEAAQWFARSKISGVKQLAAVAMKTYSRPIETPIGGLRPFRETCEECHRPEMIHGDKLYVKDKFLPDEKNTHVQTALLMKVGSGGYSGQKAHGIHWHVSQENTIKYSHADQAREDIYKVTLVDKKGMETIYSRDPVCAEENSPDEYSYASGSTRIMDCMDCHNRPTHIFLAPDEALDKKLLSGEISTDLPFIKREGLRIITQEYETSEKASNMIAIQLMSWYKNNYPEIVESDATILAKSVRGVQKAYAENVFPEMKISWGSYKNFIGHKGANAGCFRCHDGSLQSASGQVITIDCESCHIILAENKPAGKALQICSE
ncbi:MAG: NapC/NirT family cytochrome c [Proteobacteria bacterium]|nr:NapC/NirT family cytochrome c [Pseudomonadota bacterium]